MYANNLFTIDNAPMLSGSSRYGKLGDGRREDIEVRERDVVFVSVLQYGRMVLEKSFSGFGSVAELLRMVMSCLGNMGGLVTVNLRNRTCGQTAKRVLRLGRPSPTMPAMA